MVTAILDLDHRHRTPDFRKAAEAGLVGIFHAATDGTLHVDHEYWRRRQPAEDAGLAWGAYHMLRHDHVRDQMDHFLSQCMPAKGSRVAIDFEDRDCTLDDLREAIVDLQAIAPSLLLTVYCHAEMKHRLGSHPDPLLAKTSLWIAQYGISPPAWPQSTWPEWSLWQYSAGVTLDGGCNTFNGDLDACRKWMGPAGQETAPRRIRPDHPKVANIAITVSDGVSVFVTVNGRALG